MKAYIETKRLILRNFRLEDAQSMFESYCHDEEVTRYLTWYPHQNIQETIERLKQVQLPAIEKNIADFAITLKGSDDVIGSIGTVNDFMADGYAEIGYVIARKYWNQGYMSEAFKAIINHLFTHTTLSHIRAIHDIDNLASGKVMQKCGMHYVQNKQIKKKFDRDELTTCACYEIDKKEWVKKNVR